MENEERSVRMRVPLMVVVTLVIQLAGVVIWATQLDTRVSAMEEQAFTYGDLNEKFARLEERMENVKQDIGAMRQQLDKITDRLLK